MIGSGTGSGFFSKVGSLSGSGFFQRSDPDPHQNDLDPQHCFSGNNQPFIYKKLLGALIKFASSVKFAAIYIICLGIQMCLRLVLTNNQCPKMKNVWMASEHIDLSIKVRKSLDD
jgi:hypothetical protein